MLRDEDLLLALGAEMLPAEGAYAPYGRWSVFLGKDINDPQSRMVAIHEQTHGRLNRTTSYGCLLIALGLLARDTKGDRSRHARHQLEALVERSRFTHEVCATSFGAWQSGGDADLLLGPYPGYRDFLAAAREIMPGLPDGSLGKQTAVYLFARACMQSSLLGHFLDVGWERFSAEGAGEEELPDVRFSLLSEAISGHGWTALLADLHGTFDEEQLSAFEAPGLEATSDLPREVHIWLYDRFARELRRQGAAVLEFNGHNDLAIQSSKMLKESNVTVAVPHPPRFDSRARSREALLSCLGERIVLRPGRISARAPNEKQMAIRTELPGGSALHLFLVVRPLERLLSQYELPLEDARHLVDCADEGLSVAFRASHVGEDGELVVELHPIGRPDGLRQVFSEVPSELGVLSSISSLALDLHSWRERWFDAIRERAGVSMLIDLSPLGLLEERHEEGRPFEKCVVGGAAVGDASAALFIAMEGEVPHFAVASPIVAKMIAAHASLDGTKYEAASPGHSFTVPFGITITHLLTEEPWFDFGAGQGDRFEVPRAE